jgi:RNA polymerase sigma factor (sigma-70 family)
MAMAEQTDVNWNGLLGAARSGDSAAVNEMFRHVEVRLRRVAGYRLWGQPREEIEDLIQNTLLVFTEKWSGIETNPQLFAVQILHNKIYHMLRDRKGKHNLPLTGASSSDDPEENRSEEIQLEDETVDIEGEIATRETVGRIKAALMKLGPMCRKLFLALFEERTIAEIWQVFLQAEPDLKRATFDKRVFDCRKRLRAEVAGER